ncbi:MAG TPA: efflux RND transporter periplasmic adaptor subunit, partial [Candidatus Hodarchaeales archaeon]|nr:efflux RND transporter periplasmic adaptor subunit [Candidatus Hodarchaeales archaeon]
MSYYESPSDLYGKSLGLGSPEPAPPKLRSDLVVRRLTYGADEVFYVVKDPVTREYFKFPPISWELMLLFDGKHSEEEIIDEYNKKFPLQAIDEEVIETSKQDMKEMGLLEVTSVEKNLMLMERIRSQRKLRIEKKDKWTFEYMTILSFDPNDFLDRVIPYLRFLWRKPFFIISMIGILLMLVINVVRWDEFWQGTIELYSFHEKTLWDVVVFMLLFTFSLGIHELGHALTLKNYGGECHEMGFLLFYLSPAFFVESSDAYLFEKRNDRLWFSFAGVYAELLVCSLAAYIWFFTLPGTAIHDFAFLVFLFAGISGFLMNMNPLIKLDGYFILEELLGVEGLREESFNFLKHWFKRTIFRLEVEEPQEYTRRKRRIFLIYGILSILYTFSLYLLIVLWIRNIYVETFKKFGYLLLLITLFILFRKKLREAFGFLKFLYLDRKEVLMKRKASVILGFAGLAVLFLVPQTHMKISSPFVVEPIERAEIRLQNDGFIETVLVKENESVMSGQILARARNPELSEKALRVSSRLNMLDRELSTSASFGNTSEYQMKLRAKQQLLRQISEAERELGNLVLRTPIHGTIVTPRVHEKLGIFAGKGDLFCTVANLEKVKVQIPVSEYDIDDVKVGQQVLLKLDAYPAGTFEGHVEKISSAIAERVEAVEGTFTRFHVEVIIDNKDNELVPGM